MADGSLRLMQDARRDDPLYDVTRSWDIPDVPVLPGDEDFISYLRRIGFNDDQLGYVSRAFGNATGDTLEHASAEAALAELFDEVDGDGDFRVLDGYDNVPDHLAEGLDIRLNTVVERVDWSGEGVKVYTSQGVFEAGRVVITVPLGVLQADVIEFSPPLPDDKQAAIHNIRMGTAIKLVYVFEKRIAPEGIAVIFSALNPPMWWSPSAGHDTTIQVWTSFVTGERARQLLALGEEGALAQGLETLRRELDRPDLTPIRTQIMNWPAEPFTRGGYSVAKPGHYNARTILGQPIQNKLFWAGEATAVGARQATVHGAYLSGLRAADEILANEHHKVV
jgi:monoamine oxidase